MIICNVFFGDVNPNRFSERNPTFFVARIVTGSVLGRAVLCVENEKKKGLLPQSFLTNNVSAHTEVTYFVLLIMAPAYSASRNMW